MNKFNYETLNSNSELTKEELQKIVFELLDNLNLGVDKVTSDDNAKVFFRIFKDC